MCLYLLVEETVDEELERKNHSKAADFAAQRLGGKKSRAGFPITASGTIETDKLDAFMEERKIEPLTEALAASHMRCE